MANIHAHNQSSMPFFCFFETRAFRNNWHELPSCHHGRLFWELNTTTLATGVNPAGDAGDTSPQYFGWGGRQREYPRQYYYVLLDIADQYWLLSVRSASSRFHSAIRRHQFASVRQADSRLTRLVPPNLELSLTPLTLAPVWWNMAWRSRPISSLSQRRVTHAKLTSISCRATESCFRRSLTITEINCERRSSEVLSFSRPMTV